jgi:hypothetical protein
MVRDILLLGPPLADLSTVGKMRDYYPLVLMRVQNIIALIEHDCYAAAITLIPLSFVLAAVRLETISLRTRCDLLRISFFIVSTLHQARKNDTDLFTETANHGQKTTLFTSQWTIRFLNTIMLLISPLEHPGPLALDRLGTHPLGNDFGFVRMSAYDINTSEHLISKINQADLTKEPEHDLQMEEKMRKRVNLGGVHIGTSTYHDQTIDITLPAKLDPWSATIICLKAAHAKQGLLSENEHLAFCENVEFLKKLGTAANESRTQSDVNKRFISSSARTIVTLLAFHSTVTGTELPFEESLSITDPDLAEKVRPRKMQNSDEFKKLLSRGKGTKRIGMCHLDFPPPFEIEKNMQCEIPSSFCIHRLIPQCEGMGIEGQFDFINTTKDSIGQTRNGSI